MRDAILFLLGFSAGDMSAVGLVNHDPWGIVAAAICAISFIVVARAFPRHEGKEK